MVDEPLLISVDHHPGLRAVAAVRYIGIVLQGRVNANSRISQPLDFEIAVSPRELSRSPVARIGPNGPALAFKLFRAGGNGGRVEGPRQHRHLNVEERTRHRNFRAKQIERDVRHARFPMRGKHQGDFFRVQHLAGVRQALLVVQLEPLDRKLDELFTGGRNQVGYFVGALLGATWLSYGHGVPPLAF